LYLVAIGLLEMGFSIYYIVIDEAKYNYAILVSGIICLAVSAIYGAKSGTALASLGIYDLGELPAGTGQV